MNNLIISIAKERILPVSNTIDLPNQSTENQLYRMSIFLTQCILDIIKSPLNNISTNPIFLKRELSNDEKLNRALYSIFPSDWLSYALISPSYHINVSKIIDKYNLNLSEDSVKKIHQVIEFFCYELIETSVLISPYEKISQLYPYDVIRAIEYDKIFNDILYEQNIFIIDNIIIKPSDIIISDLKISRKGMRLIRIFIELFVIKHIKNHCSLKK